MLKQLEKALVDKKNLQPEFAKTVRKELEQPKGPNSERLADPINNKSVYASRLRRQSVSRLPLESSRNAAKLCALLSKSHLIHQSEYPLASFRSRLKLSTLHCRIIESREPSAKEYAAGTYRGPGPGRSSILRAASTCGGTVRRNARACRISRNA